MSISSRVSKKLPSQARDKVAITENVPLLAGATFGEQSSAMRREEQTPHRAAIHLPFIWHRACVMPQPSERAGHHLAITEAGRRQLPMERCVRAEVDET
ncbi:hypothetical protein [Bradyrhizobium sp. BR 10289]|uniref:hypothetical protein n=1 Tax=Bradyrhizobium sp. BR 10289 TaxID=2749993 RepID=UPI001C64ADDF|nr:hypothetical protein [Bradyrhizobium sp. BR 10289]MBW7974096.1 hypothetical protein [Bradyrhizobium sp. BR 10289]